MIRVVYVIGFLILAAGLHAQDGEEKQFGIKISDFVKNDFFWDSRQIVCARQGHFLLWPARESLDSNGEDINATANFNFLAIQIRLTGNITGSDAFGAKTSGVIEGASFRHSNLDLNEFRLRHAFIKLNWTNTELLVGQYWHPMIIAASFPVTISFNTCAPLQPFSRNPQFRITQSLGALSISATAFSQVDFESAGGAILLRNSALPELLLGVSYQTSIEDGTTEFLIGGGAGYKTLVPRLQTDSILIADESVGSFSSEIHLKVKVPAVTFKTQFIYRQNTYDQLGLVALL